MRSHASFAAAVEDFLGRPHQLQHTPGDLLGVDVASADGAAQFEEAVRVMREWTGRVSFQMPAGVARHHCESQDHGLEKALEMGGDYIHLIGNDATLAPDAIRLLVEACEQNLKIGAAGPLLLDPPGANGTTRRIGLAGQVCACV